MVYKSRAIAYNHETNERLTQKQVKEIETTKGFNRDNIGMIQFTEAWYLNPSKTTMTKEVLSMVLGYNFYTEDGELFGHKPVFRVVMKRSD
jgi:non-homologous end joining protein Ku